jgi:hypothetical protein
MTLDPIPSSGMIRSISLNSNIYPFSLMLQHMALKTKLALIPITAFNTLERLSLRVITAYMTLQSRVISEALFANSADIVPREAIAFLLKLGCN